MCTEDQELVGKYMKLPLQLKASFWFLICAFLQKGISVIATPVFTRLLSTAEFGQYNVFNAWMGIVGIFVSLNLSWGVYEQGLVKFEEEELKFSSAFQGLSGTLVIGWTVIYIIFRDFWNTVFSLSTPQMLSMLVMIWASAAFRLWTSAQRVHYKYRMLVLVTLIVSIAKPLVGIFFVTHAEDKVTAQILGAALVELIGYSAMFWIQLVRGKKFYHAQFWKYAVLFNLPLIPHYLSQNVLSNADRIMIERMTGAENAGIYSLAYSVSLVMTIFNTALMQTLSPWIYKRIKAKKMVELAPVAYGTLVLVAGINLLLIAFAPEVVAVFAPETYYDAIWVIPPVAMSVFFMYSYDLFAKFAFYYEKTRFIMSASIIGAILNVVLNYIFIRLFGYRAAGYTTLVCYIIYDIGHYFFMNKVCDEFCDGIRPYNKAKILTITFVFLLSGAVLLFTYKYFLLRYSLIAVMFLVIMVKRKEIVRRLEKVILFIQKDVSL